MFVRVKPVSSIKSNVKLTPVSSNTKIRTNVSSRKFSSQTYQFIKLNEKESTKGALWLQLDRQEIHNAFNEVLINELTTVFRGVSQNNNNKYRCVVLTGNGPSFSAGADLNWMKKMVNYTKEENERDSHLLFDMFHAIRTCNLPVIGRVNGAALGGGAGLVAACDFAFALKSAKLGFTEVKLGLIPAVISPFVIEKIGAGNASRYFLTGEKMDAVEARRIGLVQDCFDTEQELDETIAKIVKEIYTSGPQAVAKCKKLINSVNNQNKDYNQQSTKLHVASEIAQARISAEGQSGLSGFLNKQKPSWLA